MKSSITSCFLAAALLTAWLLPPLHAEPAPSADMVNALKAQAEHFRIVRERGEKAYYQPRFDLSALPHYQPSKLLTAWLRIPANTSIAAALLREYSPKPFAHFHP